MIGVTFTDITSTGWTILLSNPSGSPHQPQPSLKSFFERLWDIQSHQTRELTPKSSQQPLPVVFHTQCPGTTCQVEASEVQSPRLLHLSLCSPAKGYGTCGRCGQVYNSKGTSQEKSSQTWTRELAEQVLWVCLPPASSVGLSPSVTETNSISPQPTLPETPEHRCPGLRFKSLPPPYRGVLSAPGRFMLLHVGVADGRLMSPRHRI